MMVVDPHFDFQKKANELGSLLRLIRSELAKPDEWPDSTSFLDWLQVQLHDVEAGPFLTTPQMKQLATDLAEPLRHGILGRDTINAIFNPQPLPSGALAHLTYPALLLKEIKAKAVLASVEGRLAWPKFIEWVLDSLGRDDIVWPPEEVEFASGCTTWAAQEPPSKATPAEETFPHLDRLLCQLIEAKTKGEHKDPSFCYVRGGGVCCDLTRWRHFQVGVYTYFDGMDISHEATMCGVYHDKTEGERLEGMFREKYAERPCPTCNNTGLIEEFSHGYGGIELHDCPCGRNYPSDPRRRHDAPTT
jgi:hypothetical protein